MCMWASSEARKRMSDLLELGMLCGYWVLNSGPLEEQEMLLQQKHPSVPLYSRTEVSTFLYSTHDYFSPLLKGLYLRFPPQLNQLNFKAMKSCFLWLSLTSFVLVNSTIHYKPSLFPRLCSFGKDSGHSHIGASRLHPNSLISYRTLAIGLYLDGWSEIMKTTISSWKNCEVQRVI